jgi:hypothetical protein
MKNLIVAAGAALMFSPALLFGSGLVQGKFAFTEFNVALPPGDTGLGVGTINNRGWIVGYEYDPTFTHVQGWLRSPSGTILQPLVDPLDTTGTFTEMGGINDFGIVVGLYYDSAHNQYSGFLYGGGSYVTYNVPNLPAGSETDLYAINDLGDFCGVWRPSTDFNTFVPFINERGTVISFPIAGATFAQCLGLNNFGWAAGVYQDTQQYHGFLRSPRGTIITIDVPGAVPNPLGPNGSGTIALGVNDFGWVSGHFLDAAGYEHGFLRSPHGTYYQIDAPGAATTLLGTGTGGGGLNDLCTVVGHYADTATGAPHAYIAHFARGCTDDDD